MSTAPLRRNRDFMLLQTGQLVSQIGSQCTVIAYPLLTLSLTHSSAKAGFVGFIDLAPVALFLLLAGVAADRWNRKRLMIVTSVIRMLSITTLVVALALDDLTFAQLPIVAFIRTQIAEGFRFLWSQPFLRTTALIFSLGNLVSPASLLLAVIIIGKREGLSSGEIGALNAVFGATPLAGALVAGYVNRRLSMRTILVSELWCSCTCAVFLIHPSVYVLLAGTLPQSFVIPSTDTALTAYRFRVTPDRLIGRVIAVTRNIGLGITPLGPLGIGLLLATVSARDTVAIFAAIALSLAVWGTFSPSLRRTTS